MTKISGIHAGLSEVEAMASGAHVALRHMIANYPRMTALSRSLTFSLTEEGVWLVKAASIQQCVDVMMDANYYGKFRK